jgi:hypothetical protein
MGGFSGSQHDKYFVFYARRGWWQDDRLELSLLQRMERPELRQLDANTFETTIAAPVWRLTGRTGIVTP